MGLEPPTAELWEIPLTSQSDFGWRVGYFDSHTWHHMARPTPTEPAVTQERIRPIRSGEEVWPGFGGSERPVDRWRWEGYKDQWDPVHVRGFPGADPDCGPQSSTPPQLGYEVVVDTNGIRDSGPVKRLRRAGGERNSGRLGDPR